MFVTPTDNLSYILDLMLKHNLRHLPVIAWRDPVLEVLPSPAEADQAPPASNNPIKITLNNP